MSIEIITFKSGYNCVKIEDYFKKREDGQYYADFLGEKPVAVRAVEDMVIKKILGKTLTLIDATIIEKEQKKALKDIIKNIIYTEFNSLISFMNAKNFLLPIEEE